ncbi:MAG: hypothetical protein B1H07_03250 [Campylobacteraceae bacterium 4484_166]|nr:MAG: hypothetical protein B1H07_03250 [Campylobacteraceae bacterium 4484_166]
MLVHICCSVDSHYFLQQLKLHYPNEKLVGYFYNPNIHPYSEYILRVQDVRYSCDRLNIELFEGDYDLQGWLKATKGYENEPEKGSRCDICFDNRLTNTIKMAKKLDQKSFTTTLLMSPKKSQEKLSKIGEKLAKQYDIEFVFEDFRTNNAPAEQSSQSKEAKLYRQNYCGCLYALKDQREYQQKFAIELISNIGKQILPNSIEEKLNLYRQRDKLIKNNKKFEIVKIDFLNYRVLNAYVKISQNIVPSYFLIYSTIKNKKLKTKITTYQDGLAYAKNSKAIILNIDRLNKELNRNYKNTKELIYNPPLYQDEINLREKLTKIAYSNIAIIVLDNIPKENSLLFCDAISFDDTKECFFIW